MHLKDAKPGRYQPKCSKCAHRFALTISSDPAAPPEIRALPDKGSPAVAQTLASAGQTQAAPAEVTQTWQSPGAAGPTDATLACAQTTPAPAIAATLPPVAARQGTVPERWEATAATPAGSAAAATGGGRPSFSGLAVGTLLGGYRILKELGRGAMGAVYLAKQLSLDRQVALKVIQTQWANEPTFVARFMREAYAAAQLTHHNVVQIYDLSSSGSTNFFSMEFVAGRSLADVLDQHGQLPPAEAIGYVIQAARGLEFAHRHGMIHRDVKPANLLLNDQGIVKVADLGLVKTPQLLDSDADQPVPHASAGISLADARADVTMAHVAMGTPAYMSPEQAENAAGVDHRADIYSLGCTLYALLTGQPPFHGTTVMEVLTKHKTEPVVRPDALVKGLPPGLSEIVLKMVAKTPGQRYQTLGEVIGDLDAFLAKGRAGPPALGDEQLQLLRLSVGEFQGSPAARLRSVVPFAFFGFCLVAAVVLSLLNWRWAGGAAGLAAMTAAAYFVISGWRQESPVWARFRELLWNSRLSDWATWGIGALLFVLLLWLLGCFWIWLAAGVVGVALAWAYHVAVDRLAAQQRQAALDRVADMLRSLRLQGVAEESLRDFVVQYSGEGWEEFYEALFGYEAKLAARRRREEDPAAKRTPRFRAWREPLAEALDARLRRMRALREQRHLQVVEQQALQAQGVDAAQAKAQAERMAAALVGQAAPRVEFRSAVPADPRLAAAEKRERIKRMLAEARSEAKPRRRTWGEIIAASPIGFVLSGKVRFLLGCLLLAGCAMWAQQNHLFSGAADQFRSVAAEARQRDVGGLADNLRSGAEFQAEALRVPIIGPWFNSFAPGIAGAMLVILAFFRGWKMSLFALPAAALMVFGPSWGLPGIAALGGGSTTAIVLGLAVAGAGLLFGREAGE
jgi:tRNA A-37 threonylcarbamoyl transferase component Bud32